MRALEQRVLGPHGTDVQQGGDARQRQQQHDAARDESESERADQRQQVERVPAGGVRPDLDQCRVLATGDEQRGPEAAQGREGDQHESKEPHQAARETRKHRALGHGNQDDADDHGRCHEAHPRCAAGVVHGVGLHGVMQAF